MYVVEQLACVAGVYGGRALELKNASFKGQERDAFQPDFNFLVTEVQRVAANQDE